LARCMLNQVWRDAPIFVHVSVNELLIYMGLARFKANSAGVPAPLRRRLRVAQMKVDRMAHARPGRVPTLEDCLRNPRMVYWSDDGWMVLRKSAAGQSER